MDRLSFKPPGNYMLFLVDTGGRPSEYANFIWVIRNTILDRIKREIIVLVEPGKIEPDPATYLNTFELINEPLSKNKNEAFQLLGKIRAYITEGFKEGKIPKSSSDILDKAISECIKSLKM